jgi:hypothetical protein
MRICPYCAHNNREGTFFCDDCGETLVGVAYTATRKLDASGADGLSKGAWGTARVGRDSTVILRVRDNTESIVLTNDETSIGRADPATGNRPTIDLTPYGAQEKGISRSHATIRRGDETLMLIDLGSVNGTHLNGQRLEPHQPRVLRDGDEIRFGLMVCHIYFK